MALGSLDAFPALTPEDERLHAELGRALAVATRFENNCQILEGFSAAREAAQETYQSSDERIATIGEIIRKDAARKLGTRADSIVRRFHDRVGSDTKDILREAVKARNAIVHVAGAVLCDALPYDANPISWRRDHEAEMRTLVKKIALADRIVCVLLSVEDGHALPSDLDWNSYPDRAVAWVLGD